MNVRWTPHVTVAAVIERDGRFLLVEETTDDGLRLNNPAGHLDPGESPAQACTREVLEETAFHFEPTHLLGVYLTLAPRPLGSITYLRFAFVGTLGAHEAGRTLDTGIVRTLWLSPDEVRATAPRHRSPMVVRSLDDYLRGQRFPLEAVYTHPDVLQPGRST